MSKKHTIRILTDLIEGLKFKLEILGKVDNGNGSFTYTVCDLKWLKECYFISDNEALNDTFEVTIIDNDNLTFTTVKDLNIGDLIYSTPIESMHGMPMKAAEELTNKSVSARDKFPLVYIVEIMRVRHYDDSMDTRSRTADIRLIALDSLKDGYKSEDAHDKIVLPMESILNSLVEEIRKHKSVISDLMFHHDITGFNEWGIFSKHHGVIQNIFHDKCAGAMLEMPIVFGKNCDCSLCKK